MLRSCRPVHGVLDVLRVQQTPQEKDQVVKIGRYYKHLRGSLYQCRSFEFLKLFVQIVVETNKEVLVTFVSLSLDEISGTIKVLAIKFSQISYYSLIDNIASEGSTCNEDVLLLLLLVI